jgi:hypothetical protein
MAGTIVTDRIESDASYASSITVASPMVVSNTISLGSAAAISGNVNIDNGTLFVNQNNNRVGVGGITNPTNFLDVNTAIAISENSVASSNTSLELYSRFSDNQRGYVILKAESNSSGSSDLVVRSRNNFSEAEKFRIDSVGRVTKPLQPAFLASNTTLSYTGTTNTSPFAFNNTTLNIGSGFNTSTFRFTAPIAGRYLLYYSFFYDVGEGTSNCDTSFYVNGTQLSGGTATSLASRPNQDRITVGNTLVLNLNASDFVDVRGRDATGTGNAIYGPHSYFGGYLVG